MMSNLYKTAFLLLVLTFAKPAASIAQSTNKYKCMIQMTNYMGEGAYIVISLVNNRGAYEKTLYVLGANKKWYNTVKEWYKYHTQKSEKISAVTGASAAGGDRSVNVIEIDKSKINAGYKLRFESAVEDKEYHMKDLEIPLTTETLSAKNDGTGYIRYVRFSAN
ncbi:DUF2271 domain-containing protein [Pedobacter metabolipauper]|uniref:Uncharacterized protein DUF2271 n=1 Tax=Pedobacter metabolipauper TaxID=425513 RepID=A0A4R6SYI1_9SPHI|nr:DUF2271 domain-containing protein [Pedobacter metabolipauper]TDQ09772.1 uncharacterized protein DUF2271 [Pedobacter metabolipauper]